MAPHCGGKGTAMNRLLWRWQGWRADRTAGVRACGERKRGSVAVRPTVAELEGRQLLSAFARSFDGDGRSDTAVYRPSDATWHVLTSASGFTAKIEKQWGLPGDVPIQHSDFDG